MKLSDRQANFLLDIARLIFWCDSQGIKTTGGELLRTQYQQDRYIEQGLSDKEDSKHLSKLAMDFNFWINGVSMWHMEVEEQKELLKPIGEKWISLRAGNIWGGHWREPFDPGHVEAA